MCASAYVSNVGISRRLRTLDIVVLSPYYERNSYGYRAVVPSYPQEIKSISG